MEKRKYENREIRQLNKIIIRERTNRKKRK